MRDKLSNTMQRMRASRLGESQFERHRRLARTADGERSAIMRLVITASVLSIMAAFLAGCSKGGNLTLSGAKGSGDLVPLILQCTTNRGGQLPTTSPPSIQAEWTHQSRPMQDTILIPGDHFSEVQAFLRQAYGEPDSKLGSSPVRAVGIGQSVTYSPQQIGVVLNLTADSKQTIVSLMGMQKP